MARTFRTSVFLILSPYFLIRKKYNRVTNSPTVSLELCLMSFWMSFCSAGCRYHPEVLLPTPCSVRAEHRELERSDWGHLSGTAQAACSLLAYTAIWDRLQQTQQHLGKRKKIKAHLLAEVYLLVWGIPAQRNKCYEQDSQLLSKGKSSTHCSGIWAVSPAEGQEAPHMTYLQFS